MIGEKIVDRVDFYHNIQYAGYFFLFVLFTENVNMTYVL